MTTEVGHTSHMRVTGLLGAVGVATLTLAGLAPARGDAAEVTLAFAGDVHFARQLSARAKPGGLVGVTRLMGSADVAMVNLETSIGTHGRPLAKLYTFQAPPSVLGALADAGVDVVTQANNHSVDYGRAGLRDAVVAKATSRVKIVGLGATLPEAIAPYVTTVNGTTIAFFGVDAFRPLPAWRGSSSKAGVAVWKWNRSAILAAIADWDTRADVVVVYVHWGEEYDTCPRPVQRRIANNLITAGADVIVGAHPHVLQGVGFKRGALVAYSLGNFVWYGHAGTPSAVLNVKISGGKVTGYSMTPVMWDGTGQPRRVTGTRATSVRRTIAARNRCDDLRG